MNVSFAVKIRPEMFFMSLISLWCPAFFVVRIITASFGYVCPIYDHLYCFRRTGNRSSRNGAAWSNIRQFEQFRWPLGVDSRSFSGPGVTHEFVQALLFKQCGARHPTDAVRDAAIPIAPQEFNICCYSPAVVVCWETNLKTRECRPEWNDANPLRWW